MLVTRFRDQAGKSMAVLHNEIENPLSKSQNYSLSREIAISREPLLCGGNAFRPCQVTKASGQNLL